MRPGPGVGPEHWWNYAEDVRAYYPEGYIKDNMWDMTHYDYEDSAFGKAYPFHMGK
jgi:hypothetical protein